jgi:hypothetical protein
VGEEGIEPAVRVLQTRRPSARLHVEKPANEKKSRSPADRLDPQALVFGLAQIP